MCAIEIDFIAARFRKCGRRLAGLSSVFRADDILNLAC
jgi:hypothetical protein